MTGEALTPAQVIADVLNAAFDAIWFSADMVTSDLLSALDRAGYVIVPRAEVESAANCCARSGGCMDFTGALAGATPRRVLLVTRCLTSERQGDGMSNMTTTKPRPYILLIETSQGGNVAVQFPSRAAAEEWEQAHDDVTVIGLVPIESKTEALR